jgi:hypothetical protein
MNSEDWEGSGDGVIRGFFPFREFYGVSQRTHELPFNCHCTGWYSNRTPPEQESRVTPTRPPLPSEKNLIVPDPLDVFWQLGLFILHVDLFSSVVYLSLNITSKYLCYVPQFKQACRLKLTSVANLQLIMGLERPICFGRKGGGLEFKVRVLYLSKSISWGPAFMYKILWY